MTIHLTTPAQLGLDKARRSAERYRADIIEALDGGDRSDSEDDRRLLQAVTDECARLGQLVGTSDRHIATILGLPPVDGETETPMDRLDPGTSWPL